MPSSHAQERIDHDAIDRLAPQLLYERRLVEGDACRKHFVYDSFALLQHFRTNSESHLLVVDALKKNVPFADFDLGFCFSLKKKNLESILPM